VLLEGIYDRHNSTYNLYDKVNPSLGADNYLPLNIKGYREITKVNWLITLSTPADNVSMF